VPATSSLLAFTAAAVALIVVPGPSVLFVVSRGVALGRRAALLSVVGNAAGFSVHVIGGLIFLLLALVCDSTWAVAAGSARNALAASPRRLERMGGAGGLVMIGLGARLALVGRTD